MYKQQLDLKKHIKEDAVERVYLVFGKEAFFKNLYFNRLIDKAAGKTKNDFDFAVYTGDEFDFVEFCDSIEIFPLMSEKRVTVVDGLKLDDMHDKDFDSLLDVLKDTPETTTVIAKLDDDRLKKTARLKQLITVCDSVGVVCEFKELSKNDAQKFVVSKAAKEKAKITAQNANYLIELIGVDIARLDNEVKKIASFVGEKEITKKDIDDLCANNSEVFAFNLSKYLVQKDSQNAFAMLMLLKENRFDPIMLLAVIITSFIDLYRAKIAKNYDKKEQDLIDIFEEYRKSKVRISKSFQQTSRYSLDELRTIINCLIDADVSIKSTNIDNFFILEKLIKQILTV